MCAKSYEETTERLKEIESKILEKRSDLRQFETEYRKVSCNISVPSLLCNNEYDNNVTHFPHLRKALTKYNGYAGFSTVSGSDHQIYARKRSGIGLPSRL